MKHNPAYIYSQYVMLKAHFRGTFDIFKYNESTKTVRTKQYEARHDKQYFEKLSRHKDPIKLMLANFVDGQNEYIKDMVTPEAEKAYLAWRKRIGSLRYNFEQDLKKLKPNLRENIEIVNGQHPILLRMYLGRRINLETLIILLDYLQGIQYINDKLGDCLIWKDLGLKIQKYRPFIKYEKTIYHSLIRAYFEDINNDRS